MAAENITQSKFVIIQGTPGGTEVTFEDGNKIEVTFNPTEYSINKSNSFAESKIPGLISPIIQFNQGNTRTLKVDLLLDTQDSEELEKEDVRDKYIGPLEKLLALDSELHAPPPCKVLWGSLEFVGLLESMDKTYILFTNEGIPVRAKVKLSFKEFVPLGLQVRNPPLNSPDRRKLFKMIQGDSIWHMAYKAYGDPGLWRIIANANNIDDPANIEMGKDMIIPVLKK
jgi:hypothetical protein